MRPEVHPPAALDHSIEALLAERSARSVALYGTTLAGLAACLTALPFTRVAVSVQSDGVIRPELEKQIVVTPTAGVVGTVLAREHDAVRQGDVVAVIRSVGLAEQRRLASVQLAERRGFLHDLELLVRVASADTATDPRPAFRTERYGQEYALFVSELREYRLREERAALEAGRARQLFARGFAHAGELQDREFELRRAHSATRLVRERYAGSWQSALTGARIELAELASQERQLAAAMTLDTIRAPIAGTLEELRSVSSGSYVQAGERFAVISPATRLVAEVYVSPRDIGLLSVGTRARLLVDAFNYREWGVVDAVVTDIAGDFAVVADRPVFKVRCTLASDALVLRAGVVGRLRKGMTFRARFIVADRSLWQLLFDDVNDWLNPARARPRAAAGVGRA